LVTKPCSTLVVPNVHLMKDDGSLLIIQRGIRG